jgi:hypothetical protein
VHNGLSGTRPQGNLTAWLGENPTKRPSRDHRTIVARSTGLYNGGTTLGESRHLCERQDSTDDLCKPDPTHPMPPSALRAANRSQSEGAGQAAADTPTFIVIRPASGTDAHCDIAPQSDSSQRT